MAEKILNSFGITIENTIYEFSTEQQVDRIFKQNPPVASIITKNSDITIYISKGEDPEAIIPDVIGMTEPDALAALTIAGFKNVSIHEEESSEEIDKVFAQIPGPGIKYTKISEIIIKISRGILVPDVIGKNKAEAVFILEGLGFKVIVKPNTLSEGKVKNQIPSAGSHINYGDSVTIEIDVDTTTTSTTALQ